MKNKIRFLAMMLIGVLLSVNQVWGETKVWDFSTDDLSSKSPITLTYGQGSASNNTTIYNSDPKTLRLYPHRSSGNGSWIKFEASTGYEITAVSVTGSNNQSYSRYGVDAENTGDALTNSFSFSNKVATVSSLHATSFAIKNGQNTGSSNNTVALASITITYAATAPSCAAPTSLTNSTITTNNASVSWTSSESTFEVFCSTSSTDPASNATPTATVTAKTYTFTGLNANTTYYWWVRTKCSESSKSAWVKGTSFKTASITYTDYLTDCGPTMYDVKFYTDNGSTQYGETQQVIENGHPTAPSPNPSKNGYTFDGWSKTWNGTVVDVASQTITSNQNFYAKWTGISPTITAQPASATYTQNAAATPLSVTASLSSGTIGYQWQSSTNGTSGWTNVGTNSETYTPSTATVGTTYYRCVVTNTTASVSVNSSSATITVNAPAEKYRIFVCPYELWNNDNPTKVEINYQKTDESWPGRITMIETGFMYYGKKVYGCEIDHNPNTTIKTMQFFINGGGDAYTAGNWGNSNHRVYRGYKDDAHQWVDLSATSNASAVYLVGSFNGWTNGDANYALTKVDNNHWTGTFVLNGASSNYQFKVYAVDNPSTWAYQFSANGYYFDNTATTATQLWTNNSNDQIVPLAASGRFVINVEYYGNLSNHGQLTITRTDLPQASYAKGGSDVIGTDPATASYAPGEQFTLPANPYTRNGYDFAGWNDGTTTYNAGATYAMGSSNVTLTAQWSPKSYTLTWDFAGGQCSGTAGSDYTAGGSVQYGALITYPTDKMMSKTGYDFTGWSVTISTMPAEATTITAQWSVRQCHVTWSINEDVSHSTDFSYNDALTLPTAPTTSDCDGLKQFVGWSENAIVGITDGCPEDLFTTAGDKKVTDDVTYYAVFATEDGSGPVSYTKVTTISDGTYLMATGQANYFGKKSPYAYAGIKNDYYGDTVAVTISDNVISSKPAKAKEMTITQGTGADANYFAIFDGSKYLSMTEKSKFTFADEPKYEWEMTSDGYIHNKGTYDSNNTWMIIFNEGNSGTYSTLQYFAPVKDKTEGYKDGQAYYHAFLFKKSGGATYSGYITSCCTNITNVTPANLNATPQNDGADVYWDYVAGATGYEVSVDGEHWTPTNDYQTQYHTYRFTGYECGGDAVTWYVRAKNICYTSLVASSTFSTKPCSCTGYQFHYQDFSDNWNTNNICFESIGEGDNQLTEEFALPYAKNFNVSNHGEPLPDNKTVTTNFQYMTFYQYNAKTFGIQPREGNMGGALGRMHIFGNSGDNNKYIRWLPSGYTLQLGNGESWPTTYNLTANSATWNETNWYTDLVTLTDAQIGGKVFVGLKTQNGYVWCEPYSESINLSGLRTKSGAGDNWVAGGLTTSYANKTGKFRIHANSGDKNWYLTFVPYLQLKYNANGGSGEMAASEWYSVEAAEGDRTVTVSANSFTAPTGHEFNGWNTQADGNGTNYSAGADWILRENQTNILYAKWSPIVYNVTYNLNGGAWNGSAGAATYTYGVGIATLATNVENSGYTFGGWYDNPSFTGDPVTTISTTATGDKQFWAKWTFTITYRIPEGGGTLSSSAQTSVLSGETVTMPGLDGTVPSPNECETLIGWTTSSAKYESKTGVMPDPFYAVGETSPAIIGATTFYAVYSRPGQGASGSAELNNENITQWCTDANRGSYADPAISKTIGGYTWTTNGILQKGQSAMQLRVYSTSPVVYAQTPEMGGNISTIKITYKGVTSSTRTIYVNSAANITNANSQQIHENNTYSGNEVTIDCSSLSSTQLYIMADATFKIEGLLVSYGAPNIISTTLNCNTDILSFEVTYDANTTEFPGATTTCTSPDTHTFNGDDPETNQYTICDAATCEGMTLVGWNSQMDGQGGLNYTPGEEISSVSQDEFTLYAQFVYNVNVKDNDDFQVNVHPSERGGAIDLDGGNDVCDPAKYDFIGWTTDDPTTWKQTITTPFIFSSDKVTTYTPIAVGTQVTAVYGMSTSVGSQAFYIGYDATGTPTYLTMSPNMWKKTTNIDAATSIYKETINAAENKYHLCYMANGVKTYIYYNGSSLSTTNSVSDNNGWVITTSGAVTTIQSIQYTGRYLSYSDSQFTTHATPNPLAIYTGAKEYKYYDETTCTDEITITFNAGGGTMDPVTTQVVGHEGDVITVPTCSYPGWTFLGWVTTPAEAQTDIKIADAQIYTNEDGHEYTIGSQNETLYAYYTKTPAPPVFDGNISDVWKIYVTTVDGGGNYIYHYEVGAKNISDASAHGEYTTTTRCIEATDWAFTNVGTNQFTIQNPAGLYLNGDPAGDENDIYFRATPSVWTMEDKGNGFYKFVNENTPNRYLAFRINNGDPTFINTSTANEINSSYSYVKVGGCTDPVYTTKPGGEFTLNMLGNVRVTSTNGKTVRSVDALSISADNLTPNTAITLSADPAVLTFCDATGAALSLTTDANGKLANTAVYVKYTPTAYNTTETPTITATCGEQHQDFAGLVTGRSLPEKFIIAQKVGDDWYALPNDMTNSQTNPAAVKISAVNETTGTATIYSNVTDHLAWTMDVTTQEANKNTLEFVSALTGYLKVAETDANTIGQYAKQSGVKQNYTEFLPATTDLVDYTLYNNAQSKYVGINSTVWGVYSDAATVRFLAIDQQPAATITWQNEMLGTQHAQNAAEDGVITLPTGDAPVACERAIEAGWVFFGWGDQIATTKTATPTILVGGEVAKADKTYYAIFRRGTENVWRTSCPTVNTITYKANGGEGTDHVVYTELTTATAITVETAGFTKEGSQFIGWTVAGSEEALIQPGGTISGINSDIIVNAQWMGELVISGDVQLTSAVGQKVATATTGITFSSTDMSYATALRITYRDETNEIDYPRSGTPSYTNSEFRLCDGSGSYAVADGSNISLADVTGAYEQTYSISYTPNGGVNTLDHYTMKVEVLRSATVIATVTKNLYGRTLPEKFAIVAHVGDMWYALPNNMAGSGTYAPVAVSVDNSDASILNWTATGAKTAGYSMKAMTADHNKLRFASKLDANEYCLWAAASGNTGIRNYSATETSVNYRWTVTPQDDNFQAYTLLNENNTRTLRLNGSLSWGMYASGGTNEVYFIPLTDMEVADFQVIEWFANKVLIETNNQAINTNAAKTSVGSGEYTDATVDGTTYGTNQYTLTTGDLTTSAGQSLNIQYKTTAGDDWYINSVKVPIIVSRGTYTTSESVLGGLDKSKHQDNDLVVRDGATLTMDATTETWNTFKNVTIYPNSKVVVPAEKTLKTTTTTLFGGRDEIYDGSEYNMTTYAVPQLVLKGKLVHEATVQGLRYDMRLDDAIYYDFALPYQSKYEIVTDNKGGEDFTYWIKLYDGDARAKGGTGWAWYNWDVKPWMINVGTGYLFAAQPYAGQHYIIIRHPMGYHETDNPKGHQTGTPEGSKASVEVAAHPSTYDNNTGWNFIANPFMANFSKDDETNAIIKMGQLVEHKVNDKWDGHYEWDTSDGKDVRYVTTYDYTTGHYSQHKMSETVLPPFTGFFVQIAEDGQVVFDIAGRADAAPARMLSDDELPSEIEVTLKVNGQSENDETVMLLTKDLSLADAREFPAEQTKMVNNGILNFYTFGGDDVKMFANGMNYEEGQEWNKAGIMVKTAGEYTFSVASDKAEYIQQVILKDMDSNTEYDLMNNDAKIYLDKGEMNDRFFVKIVFGKHNIGTGNADIYETSAPEKFILNDHMYIRANGVLFDGVGKRVK